VVLGLLTTKQGALEDAAAVEARLHEATRHVPLERLAVSPQCGFALRRGGQPAHPGAAGAKLRRVGEIARRVWPGLAPAPSRRASPPPARGGTGGRLRHR